MFDRQSTVLSRFHSILLDCDIENIHKLVSCLSYHFKLHFIRASKASFRGIVYCDTLDLNRIALWHFWEISEIQALSHSNNAVTWTARYSDKRLSGRTTIGICMSNMTKNESVICDPHLARSIRLYSRG
jgi:hypothetical protein